MYSRRTLEVVAVVELVLFDHQVSLAYQALGITKMAPDSNSSEYTVN